MVKKVIVIGLDGFEPKIAEAMMAAGELPNLARLRAGGGYSRLRTTSPAQTPVAWSTFTTGTNPGGHGIFDFLTRDPKTYLPVLNLSHYEQKNAFSPPRAVNNRRGTAFWELLSAAGIPSVVLRCPCTYPPEPVKGRVLSGVGVPDLRGGLGTSTFYSTDTQASPGTSEKVVHLKVESDGKVTLPLIGPRNPKTKGDLTVEAQLKIAPGMDRATLLSDGSPNSLELRVGEWSGWLRVKFKAGLLLSVRGMVRFFLKSTQPLVELYASPVNFDPEAPLFPISSPPEYAGELASRTGFFHTTGMAEDHDGLINGRFGEADFLEQCRTVFAERERMMAYELGRMKEGFFFCLFDTPDRLQHMLWRFLEPEHPANQGEEVREFANAIREHYQECDRLVGKARQYADDQTLFITLSDHGMNSFQRGLNVNTWLYENGFLALKTGVEPGEGENGDFFRNVDWGKTRAYALGLGGIFLNLKGRESQGVLDLDEGEAVKTALIRGLAGLCDDARGQVAVRSVARREEIYRGPYMEEAPDLLLNFSEGYRVSWGTPLGGVPAGLFEDNPKRWGGDHVIDPALVPGVLFTGQKLLGQDPGLVDLAPTILAALGVPKGPAMEGRNLLA